MDIKKDGKAKDGVVEFVTAHRGKAARGNKTSRGAKPLPKRLGFIEFDPKARKEFVSGFHKRKIERRTKAEKETAIKKKNQRKQQRNEKRQALRDRMEHLDKIETYFNVAASQVDESTENFSGDVVPGMGSDCEVEVKTTLFG